MSAGAILAVLAALQVKHLLADFALQRGCTLPNKAIYGHPTGLAHAAIHGGLSWPILWAAGAGPALALGIAAAEAMVHYHVDWAKARVSARMDAGPDERRYWIAFGADQALHQLTYLGMAWALLLAA